jgi:WD40 repeat protein
LDVESGKELQVLEGYYGSVYSDSFSHDGKKIVAIDPTTHKIIRIWDTDSGEVLQNLLGQTGVATISPVFFQESKKIMSADGNGTVRIWDAESGSATFGKELQKLEGPKILESLRVIAFSPDGKKIVSETDGRVRVWTLE